MKRDTLNLDGHEESENTAIRLYSFIFLFQYGQTVEEPDTRGSLPAIKSSQSAPPQSGTSRTPATLSRHQPNLTHLFSPIFKPQTYKHILSGCSCLMPYFPAFLPVPELLSYHTFSLPLLCSCLPDTLSLGPFLHLVIEVLILIQVQ